MVVDLNHNNQTIPQITNPYYVYKFDSAKILYDFSAPVMLYSKDKTTNEIQLDQLENRSIRSKP